VTIISHESRDYTNALTLPKALDSLLFKAAVLRPGLLRCLPDPGDPDLS
jgi:hypothetical protein